MLETVGLPHYLTLAALIFSIGMIGVLVRRNVLVMLMSVELMLNSVNLTFIAFSRFTQKIDGEIAVIFVMTIAAAEAAVGLALAVSILKRFKDINIQKFEHLKG